MPAGAQQVRSGRRRPLGAGPREQIIALAGGRAGRVARPQALGARRVCPARAPTKAPAGRPIEPRAHNANSGQGIYCKLLAPLAQRGPDTSGPVAKWRPRPPGAGLHLNAPLIKRRSSGLSIVGTMRARRSAPRASANANAKQTNKQTLWPPNWSDNELASRIIVFAARARRMITGKDGHLSSNQAHNRVNEPTRRPTSEMSATR